MPHVKDRDERWALGLLGQIIQRDREDRDALSGTVIDLVKRAARILRQRQEYKGERHHRTRRDRNLTDRSE